MAIAEAIIDAIAAAIPGAVAMPGGEKFDASNIAVQLGGIDPGEPEGGQQSLNRLLWNLTVAFDLYVVEPESEWKRVLFEQYAAVHAAVMSSATYVTIPEWQDVEPGPLGEPETTTETNETVAQARVEYTVRFRSSYFDVTV